MTKVEYIGTEKVDYAYYYMESHEVEIYGVNGREYYVFWGDEDLDAWMNDLAINGGFRTENISKKSRVLWFPRGCGVWLFIQEGGEASDVVWIEAQQELKREDVIALIQYFESLIEERLRKLEELEREYEEWEEEEEDELYG